MKLRLAFVAIALSLVALPQAQAPKLSGSPTIEQFLQRRLSVSSSPRRRRPSASPWMAYEEGKRNVYTAAAPAFSPVRLTSFTERRRHGHDRSGSADDGPIVVFVRGHAPNRDGWVANPSSNPDGAERAIWAARTAAPGVAWRVAEGAAPELAPDGSAVLFARDGQIYRARVTRRHGRPRRCDRGEAPFIKAWGTNSAPRWSPDGKYISFVSQRTDHSFIGIYDVATRTMKYMAPGVDFDSSPDLVAGRQAHRVHPPARVSPFGQQAQQGGGGIGMPNGPAFNPQNAGRTRRRAGRGRAAEAAGRGGGAAAGAPSRRAGITIAPVPGLDARDVPRRLHAFDVGRRSRHRRGVGVLAHHAGRTRVHVDQQHSVGGRSRHLLGRRGPATNGIAGSRCPSPDR